MASKDLIPRTRGANLDRLNDKQRLFVDHYLGSANQNASEAARLAGYRANEGYKLIRNKTISAYMGKEIKERSDRIKIGADRVILEMAAIALSNVQDTMDEDGKYLPPHLLDRAVAASIYAIEWRNTRDPFTGIVNGREVSNYLFWDKMSSLNMLGRSLGVFDVKTEHAKASSDGLLAQLLALAQSRNSVVDGASITQLALET